MTWTDTFQLTPEDPEPPDIKAQVFDAAGARVGGEFLVNSETISGQSGSKITGLSGGGFVVTWTDQSGAGSDDDATGIKAQIFDAVGARVGGEFLVNTQTAREQYAPTITGLSGGGFVVTWEDYSSTLGDAVVSSIKAQMFDAAGARIGGEFLVNTQTASYQGGPTITGLSGGGFVVTWVDGSGTLGDASLSSVKAQIFDAVGVRVGGEFLVNTQTASGQYYSTITGLSGGGFVVTWMDEGGTLGDASLSSIKAQEFDAAGVKIGDEFLVNTQTTGYQNNPSITGLSGGGFVVTWQDSSGTLGDASGSSIKAQIFGSGSVVTDELQNIENLIGSAFDDSLTGDAGANRLDGGLGNDLLIGGRGDDLLIGGLGADQLIGGGGVDTADYGAALVGVIVDLKSGVVSGGAGADSLSGIENLTGSAFNDTLTGSDGNNILTGGSGDDSLVGGKGNDALIGGDGVDTASYASSIAGITASLLTSKAAGAGKDSLSGIENLTGSAFKDVLTGDAGVNALLGGSGNDSLEGGAGDDRLDGGVGQDVASYASTAVGVTVSLALAGAQNTVGAGTDTLIGIEDLTGSGFNDILTGNALANLLTGGAGNDSLDGGDGVDTLLGGGGGDTLLGGLGNDNLTGGAAADILTGGVGKDRFIYLDAGESTKSARDLITDLTAQDSLDLSAIDADTITAGDQAFVRVGAFSGAAGQYSLTYDAITGQSLLQADINGDSRADLVIAFTGDVTGMTAGWVL